MFLEKVANFEEVTAEKAQELVEARAGHIIFVGRETCPFCRKFVKTLSEVAKAHALHIYFVHSQRAGSEEQLKIFRDHYGIATVPALLYSDQETPVRVRCDSSMSADEILEFVRG